MQTITLPHVDGLVDLPTEQGFPWETIELEGLTYSTTKVDDYTHYKVGADQHGPFVRGAVTVVSGKLAIYGQAKRLIKGGRSRTDSYWIVDGKKRRLAYNYELHALPGCIYGVRRDGFNTRYLIEGKELGPFVHSRVGQVDGRIAITARRRHVQADGSYRFTCHLLMAGEEIDLPEDTDIFLAPKGSDGKWSVIIGSFDGDGNRRFPLWYVLAPGHRIGPYLEKPKVTHVPEGMNITGWQKRARPLLVPRPKAGESVEQRMSLKWLAHHGCATTMIRL